MTNKDRYKKEMKKIIPSKELVEKTVGMVEMKKEKRGFYRKPVVAFACTFVVVAVVAGMIAFNGKTISLGGTNNIDYKASRYISEEKSKE